MMGEGWADFHRDLRLEMTHDALIVDVRGNRGGHVSELVVEKLARRVLGWDVPRGLMPATYPQDVPRGPLVALSDEFAGSDGDVVTAAIRALRLGPVVGARTWGGVIGIDGMGEHVLLDGTAITVPRYAIWIDGYGWDLENRGAEPDVEVLNSPADWAAGRPGRSTGGRGPGRAGGAGGQARCGRAGHRAAPVQAPSPAAAAPAALTGPACGLAARPPRPGHPGPATPARGSQAIHPGPR